VLAIEGVRRIGKIYKKPPNGNEPLYKTLFNGRHASDSLVRLESTVEGTPSSLTGYEIIIIIHPIHSRETSPLPAAVCHPSSFEVCVAGRVI
jgi:hypothetical protein